MMKEYLTALQSIDREALKAKAEVARGLAGEYAQQAKAVAGEYAQQAKAAAGAYAQQAAAVAGEYAQEARARAGEALHSPRAEAFAASAKTLAKDVREDASDWCAFSTNRVSNFSPFDLAVFKVVLVSFGLWLGAWLASRFSKLMEKFRPVFFAMFCCGFTYIAYRIFFDNRE